MDNILRIEF